MARPPHTTDPTGVGDTRSRIQQVALELFTEQGYDGTSLREIAERLGVTKAALYYHFRTKDEIAQSLVGDQIARLDALIEWAREQPPTRDTRREFVRRYAGMLYDSHNYSRFMRFLERNQTSMHKLRAGAELRDRMMAIQAVLTPPDAPLTDRLRRSLGVFVLHSTWFTLRGQDITDEQRHDAALEVALSLVD